MVIADVSEYKNLIKIQPSILIEPKDISNQDDLLMAHLYILSMEISSLFPSVSLQYFKKEPISKAAIKDSCTRILKAMLSFCNKVQYDLPEESEFVDFEASIPLEIKNDAGLTLFAMICSAGDLALNLYTTDTPGSAWDWSVEDQEEYLETDVLTILIGVQHLGRKFGFKVQDIIADI